MLLRAGRVPVEAIVLTKEVCPRTVILLKMTESVESVNLIKCHIELI